MAQEHVMTQEVIRTELHKLLQITPNVIIFPPRKTEPNEKWLHDPCVPLSGH